MSNPSFSNIDRWLFELMEGNLSPEQIAQLEAFMLRHPELDVDKDVWAQAKVDQQEFIYPYQDKFVRRRPLGLYSAIGFFTIALLTTLAVYTNLNPNFTKDSVLSSNQLQIENEKNEVIQKVNSSNVKLSKKPDETTFQVVSRAKPSLALKRSEIKVESNLSVVLSADRNRKKAKSTHSLNENKKSNVELVIAENPLNSRVNKLVALKASLIDVGEAGVTNESNTKRAVRFAKTGYKVSLGSRMHKLGRSLQRMLDNPVALRNQRDPYYHVPGMQAMDINFGAVGTMLATRFQTVTRTQWLGEENQQITNQLSLDGYSYGMRGGIGFQMNHSYYGNGGIENYHAALIYSPKFSVASSITVEPSLRFKMGSKVLNTENLTPGDLVEMDRFNTQGFFVDGSVPLGKQLWYKDLGIGLMVNTKWFYAGIQGDNLFKHYDNIYSSSGVNPRRVGNHFVATIGTDYESIRKTITVSPYIVYQQQENLREAWLGSNVRLKWLTIGAALSSNYEPAASLGLKFRHFAITYNADLTKSQMLNQKVWSHQLTLRFVTKPSRIGQRLLN
jgi:type IX secretion system PorP/SprF family membrane protein